MYLPKHFDQQDSAAWHALAAAHPFATLVWQVPDGLHAEHLPLLWDANGGAHGTLRGHVARANPVWQGAAGQPVMVVFQGPQGYISPSWYPSKSATAKVVPTWNYAVVQAHGPLHAVEDAAWLHGLVERLTNTFEGARAHPWRVSDAPADYIDAMKAAIVGIEIPVQRVQAKFKLSQNRSPADVAGVVAGLTGECTDAARSLAQRMTKPGG